MIAHLSYVMCDRCGNPASTVGDGAKEARRVAAREGFVRHDGEDLCPWCVRALDEAEGVPDA